MGFWLSFPGNFNCRVEGISATVSREFQLPFQRIFNYRFCGI